MSEPMAGWYPDPEAPERQRFWDGTQWTEARAYPAGAAGSEAVAEKEAVTESRNNWRWIAVIALVAAALLAAAYWFFIMRAAEPEPLPPLPTLPTPVPTVTSPVTPPPITPTILTPTPVTPTVTGSP